MKPTLNAPSLTHQLACAYVHVLFPLACGCVYMLPFEFMSKILAVFLDALTIFPFFRILVLVGGCFVYTFGLNFILGMLLVSLALAQEASLGFCWCSAFLLVE